MKTNIVNHKDVSIKFTYKTLGEAIHDFFGLKGDYIGLRDNEVVTMLGRNLRKDISYKRTGQIVNCIEMQTYPVDDIKAEPIAEYVSDVLRNDDQQLADSIILTTVDPKLCKKRIRLTETLILEPIYIYISPSEVMEMFNNIENKVLNNQILSSKEELEFIIIPIFLGDDKKEEITSRLCYLFKEYSEVMDYTLSLKISFVLWLMIDRNIEDSSQKNQLNKVIDMEQKMDSLQELINEEKKEVKIALKKANTKIKDYEIQTKEHNNIIKEQGNRIKEQNNELLKKDNTIKEKDSKIKEKDNIIKQLSLAISKSSKIPYEALIAMTNTNFEE